MYLRKQSTDLRIITRVGNNFCICCKSPKRCVKLAVTVSLCFMFDVCLMGHLRWSFIKKLLLTMNADFQLETLMVANDKKIAHCKSIIRAEPWYLMESFYFKDCPFSTTWSAHQKKKHIHYSFKSFSILCQAKVNSNKCRLNLFGYR